MSASRIPPRAFAGQAKARLAAVVDLPTPPLPEATAMFLTLAMAGTWAWALCAAITQSIDTWAPSDAIEVSDGGLQHLGPAVLEQAGGPTATAR
jgi:hypothetical protein